MIEPPSPIAAVSLVDLTTIFRQHRQMQQLLRLLSETIADAGCRPEPTAAMQRAIERILG